MQVSNGQFFDLDVLEEGSWVLVVMASDKQGNHNELWGDGFNVMHDVLPPRTDLEVEGPSCRENEILYISAMSTVRMGCADDMKDPDDHRGSGIKETYVAIGSTDVFQLYADSLTISGAENKPFTFQHRQRG